MVKFYKMKFKKFTDKNHNKPILKVIENLESVQSIYKDFITEEFGAHYPNLDIEKLVVYMLVVLYNDRVNVDKNGKQQTKDKFLNQAIDKLKQYGHERAFRIYWEAKGEYNEERL